MSASHPFARAILFGLLCCALALGGCSSDTTATVKNPDELDRAIDAGNGALDEADRRMDTADMATQRLMAQVATAGLDVVRQNHKATAEQLIQQYMDAAAQYRVASQEFTAAAELVAEANLRRYFELKAQSMTGYAEGATVVSEMPAAVIDPKLPDMEAVDAQIADIAARASNHVQQADSLDGQAEDLADQNPNLFAPPEQSAETHVATAGEGESRQ